MRGLSRPGLGGASHAASTSSSVIHPCRPIYDDSVADSYRGRTRLELPPHAFAIAEAAYTNLLTYGLPQGIIVSGESGAGKTEACRVILGYIARVSGAYAAASAGKGKYKPGQKAAEVEGPAAVALRVRDRLVTSGLVMEAFGNAQTLRNDNSRCVLCRCAGQ